MKKKMQNLFHVCIAEQDKTQANRINAHVLFLLQNLIGPPDRNTHSLRRDWPPLPHLHFVGSLPHGCVRRREALSFIRLGRQFNENPVADLS